MAAVNRKTKDTLKEMSSNQEGFGSCGIMRKINDYMKTRELSLRNNDLYPKYKDLSVERLIGAYKRGGLPDREKAFVLETIYLKIFFFFPYFLSKKNYVLNPVLYDETIQNISQVILDAMARFDPDRGKTFLSYAYGDIMSAISKTFRDLNTVQIPHGSKQKTFFREESIRKEGDEDEDGHASSGTEREGDSVFMCRDISADKVLCSKTAPYNEEDRPAVVEYDEQLNTKQLVEWLEEALSAEAGVLSEDERMVVALHNGLFGCRPHIYSEIATIRKKMGKGASRSRISQIHTKALSKLRKWFRSMDIEPN